MDLMELRRGLLTQMTSGANVIKGTFTVPTEGDNYTLNIGRTLDNYMFYVEMIPDSITRLSQTASSTTRKAYSLIGLYKFPVIAGSGLSGRILGANYRTSDGSRGVLAASISCTDDSIMFITTVDNNTQPGVVLYKGYTYNYTIFPMD